MIAVYATAAAISALVPISIALSDVDEDRPARYTGRRRVEKGTTVTPREIAETAAWLAVGVIAVAVVVVPLAIAFRKGRKS